MSFFREWIECVKNGESDDYYINSFLYRSQSSIEILENASKKEIREIIDFFVQYNQKKIVDKIGQEHIKKINASEVVQYSSFANSTSEITHILKYETNGLTFEDLGYLLIGSKTKVAAVKYGENQAKTARVFSLVKFEDSKPIVVKNTSLGDMFPLLNENTQKKLLSILCLRDPVVINAIAYNKFKKTSIEDICSCLSSSTFIRRKMNVFKLLKLALENVDDDLLGIILHEEE